MGWMWSYYRNMLCLAVLAVLSTGVGGNGSYFGRGIGLLSQNQHKVKGEVFAVDSRTLHIRGFSYDGTAPDAFFYAGSSGRPSNAGFIIPDENGGVKPLGSYDNRDVTLTLPDGKTFKDITWISIWCRAYSIDFGSLAIPPNLDYPRPQKINAIPTQAHGVSSERVVVVDAQTFLLPNLSYDGIAPDAHFWVSKGSRPGPGGMIVPDENGSEEPLKKYSGKTIVITLPGDTTVFDFDTIGIWCKAYNVDFGHVTIPKNLNVPPSLKMLGVAPQSQGYSYRPPSSSGRPAFSYDQPKTASRPSYSPPARPSTTPRPSYSAPSRPPTTRKPSHRQPQAPRSPFTSSGFPYQTTKRPRYEPPTTTGRPFYNPPTTKRPAYPRTTTRRPNKRPSHLDSDESREDSRSRGFGGHFGVPQSSFPPKRGRSSGSRSHGGSSGSSSSRGHFGSAHFGSSGRKNRDDDDDDSDEDKRQGGFPPSSSPSHRFGPSSSEKPRSNSKSFSTFHFSSGGSTSSFNLYG